MRPADGDERPPPGYQLVPIVDALRQPKQAASGSMSPSGMQSPPQPKASPQAAHSNDHDASYIEVWAASGDKLTRQSDPHCTGLLCHTACRSLALMTMKMQAVMLPATMRIRSLRFQWQTTCCKGSMPHPRSLSLRTSRMSLFLSLLHVFHPSPRQQAQHPRQPHTVCFETFIVIAFECHHIFDIPSANALGRSP